MEITSTTDASALYARDTRQTRRLNLHGDFVSCESVPGIAWLTTSSPCTSADFISQPFDFRRLSRVWISPDPDLSDEPGPSARERSIILREPQSTHGDLSFSDIGFSDHWSWSLQRSSVPLLCSRCMQKRSQSFFSFVYSLRFTVCNDHLAFEVECSRDGSLCELRLPRGLFDS